MEKTVEQYLPQIRNLFKKYGVERAYLFGSAAKNISHQSSDVDFIISFLPDMDYETYGSNYFNLLYALQDLLHKNVDLVTEKTLINPYLLQSINQHKVQLL